MKEVRPNGKGPGTAAYVNPALLDGAKPGPLPQIPLPALATPAVTAPAGDEWLHEIKFDGYRILARCNGDSIKLISRNGKDWTRRFNQIATWLKHIAAEDAVLDGEVVSLTSTGISSFSALQEALSATSPRGLAYQVFDLIYLNGLDLSQVPLAKRKLVLADLLSGSNFPSGSKVRYTAHIQGSGPAFAEQACRLGLEGIISKRANARYPTSRSKSWLKIKCKASEDLIVCGYTKPAGIRAGFGALLLSAYDGRHLVYVGRVGTGFSARTISRILPRLRGLNIETCPLDREVEKPGVQWVRPELVAEVEFTEWTRDGLLRHPSFKGLREDRDPAEISLPFDVRLS